jgi:hypothetical protein
VRQRGSWQAAELERSHVLAVCPEALVAGGPMRLLNRVTLQFLALSTRLIAVPMSPVDPVHAETSSTSSDQVIFVYDRAAACSALARVVNGAWCCS